MRTWMAVLMCSVLGLCPVMIEVGTAGTTGQRLPEQKPLEQKRNLTKDNIKLIQERLTAEGVYAGPVDGEVNAQTAAALRQYQQKRGLPVSGTADEATLKELQIELPASSEGER
jgi:peptidoglycan hydrolase-like protein with peptidoglycan-binding domain